MFAYFSLAAGGPRLAQNAACVAVLHVAFSPPSPKPKGEKKTHEDKDRRRKQKGLHRSINTTLNVQPLRRPTTERQLA